MLQAFMQLMQPDRASRHVTEHRPIQAHIKTLALDLIIQSLQHHVFHSHGTNNSQGDLDQIRPALQTKTPA